LISDFYDFFYILSILLLCFLLCAGEGDPEGVADWDFLCDLFSIDLFDSFLLFSAPSGFLDFTS
jgi:hypothetical protein